MFITISGVCVLMNHVESLRYEAIKGTPPTHSSSTQASSYPEPSEATPLVPKAKGGQVIIRTVSGAEYGQLVENGDHGAALIVAIWGLIFMCICRVTTGQWWMTDDI